MYSIGFQKHLYDESALSRFEGLTKPLFGAVHPNVQIDANLDYMISQVLL